MHKWGKGKAPSHSQDAEGKLVTGESTGDGMGLSILQPLE